MVIVAQTKLKHIKNFTGVCYPSFNNFKTKYFRKNNMEHRYYGPANIGCGYCQWQFNNRHYGWKFEKSKLDDNYSQKQFLKDLNKLWLL